MNVTEMTWNPTVECFDVGVVGDEIVSIIPMIFNHRVTTGPVNWRGGYDHGWCYDSRLAAVAAVAVWDPATEAEPPGYLKKATPGRREVPCRI